MITYRNLERLFSEVIKLGPAYKLREMEDTQEIYLNEQEKKLASATSSYAVLSEGKGLAGRARKNARGKP